MQVGLDQRAGGISAGWC